MISLPAERQAFFYKLVFVVFVLLVPALLGSASRVFLDGDVSWHVATGQWILANGRVPKTDPFSFTMAGQPWVAHEWLADILFAAMFDLAGFAGLAVVVVLALVGLNWIVFLYLRPRAGPIGLFLALLGMSIALSPFVLARPHVLVWPLLAGWTVILLRAADSGRPPPVWLPLLMILWANLHGSFLLGMVIYAFLALEALAKAGWRPRTVGGWALVGLACLASTLLNANSFAGLIHPLTITGMETLPLIEEWKPTSIERSPFFLGLLAVTFAAIFVIRPKLPAAHSVLIVLLLAMALLQVRHQSWLAIVTVLALVPHLTAPGRAALFATPGARRSSIVGVSVAVAAFVVVRMIIPFVPEEHEGNPAGLLAAVPDELREAPVLNGYSFGGPLILHGYRPYIDGRADMYGDAFVKDWRRVVDGDVGRFNAAVRRYGLQWTMLPEEMALVRHLDRSADWRRIYADDVGVIHIREPARRGPNRASSSDRRSTR
jgi:hypothetical protein